MFNINKLLDKVIPKNKKYKYFVMIGISVSFIYIIGFFIFLFSLHSKRYVAMIDRQAEKLDAVIVLTGGSGRVPMGLKLLEKKRADLLFISGLYTEDSLDYYNKLLNEYKNIDEKQIYFDTVATTTIENAIEIYKWTLEHKISSAYIITSYYHMPRSMYWLKTYIPNVKMVPYPVFPELYKKHKWFNSPRIFSLIFFEYNKYIISNIWVWSGFENDNFKKYLQ